MARGKRTVRVRTPRVRAPRTRAPRGARLGLARAIATQALGGIPPDVVEETISGVKRRRRRRKTS